MVQIDKGDEDVLESVSSRKGRASDELFGC